MKCLAFEIRGRVEAVLVAKDFDSLVSTGVRKIKVIQGHGVHGDRHAGTRLADVRERELLSLGLPKGIEIANQRQFSAVSREELNEIAVSMELPDSTPYGCLGENLVLSGIPTLSHLPTGTMLFFQKPEGSIRTAVLIVWSENAPCQGPGEIIQQRFPGIPQAAKLFSKSAIGKRGIVGSVYVSGEIHSGDIAIVRIPDQQIYEQR